MNELEILQRAGLATAIGLLIGIERGWQARQAKDGERVAGIRTFTLIGGLGGICGLLPGAVTLGLCLAGFAIPFGFFEWRRAREAASFSATGFIAGLLTFALGAYAIRGSMMVAAAGGVVVAAILAERRVMHSFLKQLKWTELRAALVLLTMTVVLLPALPNRTVDPWNALNPHQIWLMTVLVGAVSYAGYIAVRIAGERRGLLFAAIAGGIATSTTVTWTFARLVKANPAALPEVMAAILAAWIVSLLRMTAIAVAVAPNLLVPLFAPVGAASLVLLIPAALAFRAAGKAGAQGLALQDPFELPLMLRFTVLLAAIMLLSKFFSSGQSGLFALGGVSGLLDVDPITLSMARLAGTGISRSVAVSTILIAATANGLSKSVLALVFGGSRLGLALSALALLAFGVGAAAYFSAA
ncbi:MAG TPA: DUF4010 domain-containing protein [Rhizomicrobium sp.]|nr:DUF4010 domain-containing protein [Rhizomicrobium sp.]